MTPRPLGLFVKELQPKVGLGGYTLFAYFVVEVKSNLGGYDILLAYFVVEAKSNITKYNR